MIDCHLPCFTVMAFKQLMMHRLFKKKKGSLPEKHINFQLVTMLKLNDKLMPQEKYQSQNL